MRWLAESWHKILIALLFADQVRHRIAQFVVSEKVLEEIVEDRVKKIMVTRRPAMNLTPVLDVLKQVVSFVDIIFKKHAPEIVQAAENAGVAAAEVAGASAEQDPKVKAAIDLYNAAKGLKTALDTPPAPPPPPAAS